MRKLPAAVIAAVIFAVSPLLVAAELDLGEVFIWGEDRSVLPGLTDEGIFLYPILAKSSFLPPLKSAWITKVMPEEDFQLSGGGTSLSAGAGGSGEYLLCASGSRYASEGFYFWRARSRRDYTHEVEGGRGSLTIGGGGGGSRGELRWAADTEYSASRHLFDRALWRASGEVAWNPGFSAGLSVSVSGTDADKSGRDGNIVIEGSNIFFFRHKLMFRAQAGVLGVDGNSRKWLRHYTTYLNTAYRDFSFEAGAGGRRGEKFDWHLAVSGEVLGAGYRVSAGRETEEPDFFALHDIHPLLGPRYLYDAPRTSALGLSVFGNIQGVDVYAKAESGSAEGYLGIVGEGRKQYPVNLPGRSSFSRFKLGAEKGAVSLSATYPSGNLPGMAPETEISVSGRPASGKSPLELSTSLRYTGPYDRWLDEAGAEKERVHSSVSLAAEVCYHLTQRLRLRAGGKNIASSRIEPQAGITCVRPVYYMILETSF